MSMNILDFLLDPNDPVMCSDLATVDITDGHNESNDNHSQVTNINLYYLEMLGTISIPCKPD